MLALVSAALLGAATPLSKYLLMDLGPFQISGLLYLGAAVGGRPATVSPRPAPHVLAMRALHRRPVPGALRVCGLAGWRVRQLGVGRAPQVWRPIQTWVPEVRPADFQAEARRQARAVAASGQEADDLAFIASLLEWDEE